WAAGCIAIILVCISTDSNSAISAITSQTTPSKEAKDASFHLYLFGEDRGVPAHVKADNDWFITYGKWLECFPIEMERASARGLVFERSDGLRVRWRVGTLEAVVGSKRIKLPRTLRVFNDRLHIPLKVLCKLTNTRFIYDAGQNAGYVCAMLTEVQLMPATNGWQLNLRLTAPVTYRIDRLSNPDRIYIDLHDAVINYPPGVLLERHGSIASVRIGQFSTVPATARVVLDMDEPLNYEDRTEFDDNKRATRISLFIEDAKAPQPPIKPSINNIELQVSDRDTVTGIIRVERAYDYTAFTLIEPFRVVLDFRNADFVNPVGVQQIPKNPLVREIRTGMPDIDSERVARVVFELHRPAAFRIIEKRDEGLIIVRIGKGGWYGLVIVIDPGHGGRDPGARSPVGMFKERLIEKDLTLDIALRLNRMLMYAGAKPMLTRTTDCYVSLQDRVAFANAVNARAFVSIHLNAWPKPGGNWGTEVYYYTPQSRPLAEAVHKYLIMLLQRKDNGIRRRRFYVVRRTSIPSVLVEACYINHPEDGRLLQDDEFREKIAKAIFLGLHDYFGVPWNLQLQGEEIVEDVAQHVASDAPTQMQPEGEAPNQQ
ncbi:MAG TPA: N-acetylmuramoyl-L-alanine amidase, partial [Armatimonadetes bacterium]|nr:N-acetylmuramoyl-L-alanine amidase [Armatimonadota bacterium]